MTTTSAKASVSHAAGPQQRSATAGPALRGPATVAQQLGNERLQMLLRARLLQAKLTVSHPQDVYEQEADRVADHVMRMADPAAPMVAQSTTRVQRRCDCEEELPLQRADASAANVPTVDAATESSIHALSTRGSALPESVRSFMEPRFNTDFGAVRVHNDAHAHGLARAVNAQAFTVGRDVVFGAGHYAPETEGGTRLLAHELTHVVQQGATRPATAITTTSSRIQRQPASVESAGSQLEVTANANAIAFVRFHQDETSLRLSSAPDEHSPALRELAFGQRLHILEDATPRPGWRKVNVLGQTGYVPESRIHPPPAQWIQKDPALRLIRVRPGLTFYGLVHEMYGIKGDESTKDQNMNHFINAIRAFNQDKAFTVKAGVIERAKNVALSGRDAKNTYLKANFDLWIPSFSVAAKMDVGSGTAWGNAAHFLHKIEQKLADFANAGLMSGKYITGAVTDRVGELAEGLIPGLIDFAILAVKIMTVSTGAFALLGALFGGVGAAPGAEIGFELGLLILEYYGLVKLVESILSVAGTMLTELGRFISLAWNADGDEKQLDLAARSLADFLGTLASAALIAAAAYLLKKGANALKGTKFARTLGESRLAEWFRKRQQLTTTQRETRRLASAKEPRQLPAGDETPHGHEANTSSPTKPKTPPHDPARSSSPTDPKATHSIDPNATHSIDPNATHPMAPPGGRSVPAGPRPLTPPPVPERTYSKPVYTDANQMGEGQNKLAYRADGEVVSVPKDPANWDEVDTNIALLDNLRTRNNGAFKPYTAEAHGPYQIQGRRAMVAPEYGEGSRSIVAPDRQGGWSVTGKSKYLNQNSINDINRINELQRQLNVDIWDKQYLIGKDGHVYLSDPMRVRTGTPTDYGVQDRLLIEVAKRNIARQGKP